MRILLYTLALMVNFSGIGYAYNSWDHSNKDIIMEAPYSKSNKTMTPGVEEFVPID